MRSVLSITMVVAQLRVGRVLLQRWYVYFSPVPPMFSLLCPTRTVCLPGDVDAFRVGADGSLVASFRSKTFLA